MVDYELFAKTSFLLFTEIEQISHTQFGLNLDTLLMCSQLKL